MGRTGCRESEGVARLALLWEEQDAVKVKEWRGSLSFEEEQDAVKVKEWRGSLSFEGMREEQINASKGIEYF